MGYGQNAVYFFDNTIMTILLLGIRLLWILFALSIIAGIVVEARGRGWDKQFLNIVQKLNSCDKPGIYLCTNCGQKLIPDWQYCPSCSSSSKRKSGVEKVEVASIENIQSQTSEKMESVRKEENITDNTTMPQESNNNATAQKSRKRKNANNGKSNSGLQK